MISGRTTPAYPTDEGFSVDVQGDVGSDWER
jgi:hypothetical protein